MEDDDSDDDTAERPDEAQTTLNEAKVVFDLPSKLQDPTSLAPWL